MSNKITWLIGVDGGGSGTRVTIANCAGIALAHGTAGPSGLINGAQAAWGSIMTAIALAFSSIDQAMPALSQIGIGLGLAGVHNKQWASMFAEKNPGFALIQCETDAFTTLLGAHQGQPGAIIAIGTGSVGEALLADGSHIEVGGWGFPCGDEAGGAWLGFKAINHIQQVIDGRATGSEFADAVIKHCGGDRDAVFRWLATANQQSYAQIAPIVIAHVNSGNHGVVTEIMQQAGRSIEEIARALDPTQQLPIALCGGLAIPLMKYLPITLLERLVPPHSDSSAGALLLIKKVFESHHAQSIPAI